MPKQKTQNCMACGGLMHFETRSDPVRYLEHQRPFESLGFWCSKCDEAIFDGAALKLHEKAFLQLKAEVDGVLGANEVAAVRTLLGLSQRKAGELLGGGPRAFQKYEAGTQSVSVPMSRLLTLLGKDPRRLAELTGAQQPARRVKKVG
jgi:HTH-type transcriptional regulator / antitoxin MqsA